MIVCMSAAMQGWMELGYVRKSGPYEETSPCPVCGKRTPGKMTLRIAGVTIAYLVVQDCGHAFGWYVPYKTALEENHWRSPIYELTQVTSMQDETLAMIWAEGYDGFVPNIYREGHPWYQAYEQGREDRRRAE